MFGKRGGKRRRAKQREEEEALAALMALFGMESDGRPVPPLNLGGPTPSAGPFRTPGSGSSDEAIETIGRGEQLHEMFDVTHEPRHLDEAVRLFTRVLRTAEPGELRAAALNGLGKCGWSRYERFGRRADIDQAVAHLRDAVAAAPPYHPMVPACRANLTGALVTRWSAATGPADLDEAIEEIRAALRDTSPGDPIRASRLNTLAGALKSKAEAYQDSSALGEAIRTLEESLSLARAGGRRSDVTMAASNLAEALRMHHAWARDKDARTLARAADLAREALAGTAPTHPTWARFQSNLSLVLQDLYRACGDLRDLTAAVSASRSALAATPRSHPNRVERLAAHAAATRAEFEHAAGLRHLSDPDALLMPLPEFLKITFSRGLSKENRDRLKASVRAAEEAAAATPPGHVMHGIIQTHLTSARFAQAGLTGTSRSTSPRRLVDDIDSSAHDTTLAVRLRVHAARMLAALWMLETMSDTGERADRARKKAQTAFDLALELMPRLSTQSLPRGDRERQLGQSVGLARDAAACSLSLLPPDPYAALRQLEQGRGVMLGQALDARTDVTELRVRHPRLAERYEELCRELDRPEVASFSPPPLAADVSHGAVPLAGGERHALAAQWEDLIRTVRDTPGFSGFLQPPDPVRLAAEAGAHGAVAVINVSALGCHALLLQHGHLRALPLPRVHYDDLLRKSGAFTENLHKATGTGLPLTEQAAAQQDIVRTLAWLWEAVAEPVLGALGFTGAPPEGRTPPRMWWVPTGPLTVLPLHAAGLSATPGANTLDRVVSSYTTTVRELVRTRARPSSPTRRTLAVALRHTPGAAELGRAESETRALAQHLPVELTLTGPRANYRSVLDALPHHTWAHIACHAVSAADADSGGHLLLHDHAERLLTTADIARLRLDQAELAYLSACDTLRGRDALADEAMHITGAFHTAGFTQVIGTLWPVDDEEAAEIAKDFYANVTTDPDFSSGSGALGAAHALHEAVRARREQNPDTPTLWGAHVHYGA
ncbi:CHAT domain-containing protein [Streptomyces sp. VB1]|uniref:CHAT domain-containing protein n=1 Tax=Streptomyces sp. VB1 TaxID=2986803 RepID=UPI002242C034|nr:CHAT domain-containing protein [Streptomyces sp. VB1]UZI27941.1 CHAT domain-containing protein [Streptomyces sp. VB1]